MSEEEIIGVITGLIRTLKPELAGHPMDSTTEFKADLGMDSLTQIELLWDVEKRYAVKVPDDVVPTLECIDDVARAVLGERATASA